MSDISKCNFEIRKAIRDLVEGEIDYRASRELPRGQFVRKDGTGHPWVQAREIQIDGVWGWAILDQFDSVREEFPAVTERTVREAVAAGTGLFVTASRRDCGLVTHRVIDKPSLYRLKDDMREMFGLAFLLYWKEAGEIETGVTTYCHTRQFTQTRLAERENVLIYKMGTLYHVEKTVSGQLIHVINRHTAEIAGPVDHGKTHKIFLAVINKTAQELLAQIADEEIVWGYAPELATA